MSHSHHALRLAELLNTRLCHDLTGPIGAANNGVEFLREENAVMEKEAVDLIASSVEQATVRIRFYRQAYGRVKTAGEADLEEIRRLAESFFQANKIKLNWEHEISWSFSRRMARLVLNMLIIIAEALIRGGEVDVVCKMNPDGTTTVDISGRGTSIRKEALICTLISGEVSLDEVDPSTVQPFYTGELAREIGAELAIQWTEGSVRLTASRLTPRN